MQLKENRGVGRYSWTVATVTGSGIADFRLAAAQGPLTPVVQTDPL
jgi:hypothetical protein